jgi:hemerythrin-like domain-containing protein
MMGRSPFDDIREEHASLLTEMNEVQSAIRGLSGRQLGSLGQQAVVRDVLEMFRQRFRLHCRREEEAVFPEASRLVSEGARGADVFGSFFASEAEDDMSAHAAITGHVNEMIVLADAMQEPDSADDAARKLPPLASLTAGLLQRHAAKEDTLIFPMLEKSLSIDQIDQVRSRLQEIGSARDLTPDESDEDRLSTLGGAD